MRNLLSLILGLISLNTLFSQTKVVTEEWNQIFAGPVDGYDNPNDMVLDPFGNIYITGSLQTSNSSDFCTLKYDNNGNLLWMASYNSGMFTPDESNSIDIDDSGNVYVAGYTTGLTSSRDFTVIKYNSNGIQQWIVAYDGPGNEFDIAYDVTVGSDGSVYAIGTTNPAIGNDVSDALIIKISASGEIIWDKILRSNNEGYDYGEGIKIDSEGNIICGGGFGGYYFILKYDTAGVMQWMTTDTLSSISSSYFSDILTVGNISYVTGGVYVPSQRNYIAKITSGGVIEWSGVEGFACSPSSITIDNSGNLITTGRITYLGRSNIFTLKYNPDGDLVWSQKYNSGIGRSDFGNDVKTDSAGNVYVVGTTTSFYSDLIMVKYSPSGQLLWVVTYDLGPIDSELGKFIERDPFGNIIVNGLARGRYDEGNILTIKYSETVGIQNISSEIPSTYGLGQNYPNPFNPTTNIKFALPKSGFVTLKVYDIVGKEVATLVNEQLSAGTYEHNFNASTLSSGIYFYKISAGHFTEIKKMMLVK